MNGKIKQALDLLEDLRKATLETDIDSMGGLVLTNESCFEEEINKLKDIVNDFDRYYESQQDLIKGKDEYIAKLCCDRAELKELQEFARIVNRRTEHYFQEFATSNIDQYVISETYFVKGIDKEFDLVKKVVEKHGK